MNWKEFLKPDLKKIILSIVIFVIFYIIEAIFFAPLPCALELMDSVGLCQARLFDSANIFYAFMIGNIIVAYIVSCLVFKKK